MLKKFNYRVFLGTQRRVMCQHTAIRQHMATAAACKQLRLVINGKLDKDRGTTDYGLLNAQPMPSQCKYCQPQLPHQLFLTLSSQETSYVSRTGSVLMAAQQLQHHKQTSTPHSFCFLFSAKGRHGQLCKQKRKHSCCIFLPFFTVSLPPPPPQQHHHSLSRSPPISLPVAKLLSLELYVR